MTIQTDSSHILVVANETSRGTELHELIERRAGARSEILVVAPALNSRVRHLFSDSDAAVREAELRLAECVEGLRRLGIEASGIVGDEDPLRAIEDVLHTFPADELIVSTHVPEHSNWLARDVVERASERFELPTSHVMVDTDRHVQEVVLLAA